jgi:hypothetical protein
MGAKLALLYGKTLYSIYIRQELDIEDLRCLT